MVTAPKVADTGAQGVGSGIEMRDFANAHDLVPTGVDCGTDRTTARSGSRSVASNVKCSVRRDCFKTFRDVDIISHICP